MPITFAQLGSMGRRGNQMFQAAAVIALALRNNDDYILPHCSLEGTTNIPLQKFSNNIKYNHQYKEAQFHYAEIPYKQNLNIYDSYLQSWKYFDDFSTEITRLLSPNRKVKDHNDYVAVHVRRTDYLIHTNCYNILTRQNYYDKAMERFNNKKFMIFSDGDYRWCRENFKGNDFEHIENNSEVVDMALMISTSGIIIANSTFSWWPGYIATFNKDFSVVAPKNWFGPKLHMNKTIDLIPNNWITI